MKLDMSKDRAQRLILQVSLALFLIAAGIAIMQFMKANALEIDLDQAVKSGQDTNVLLAAAEAKLVAANTRLADVEKKQQAADGLKVLMSSIEPQIAPVLEAAGKAGKPNVRAAALTTLGLIGQAAHGASNEDALAVLERAFAIDKTYCPAGLAINLSGTKKLELAPECEAFLPVVDAKAAAAPAAKPAAPAPAEAAKAAPAPAAAK
jgi:hypothetical protein